MMQLQPQAEEILRLLAYPACFVVSGRCFRSFDLHIDIGWYKRS